MKKKLSIAGAAVLVLASLTVLVVGPWPAYSARDITQAAFYQRNVGAIQASADRSVLQGPPLPLEAGWAKQPMTPPLGTPLAGYGNRKGEPSTGVHDELFVKALVLSDGNNRVVIVASDMLIVPPNLAGMVRERVADRTGIAADDILFNASHTHSGPGGWAPGFAGKQFSGGYDESVLEFLAQQFTEAIVEANANVTSGAALGTGSVEVDTYIRNRAREGATDSSLDFMVIEKHDGSLCYLVRYSAHSTVLGASNMEFSGDYPGYLERAIERETGGFAMFLAGAMGSMGVRSPGDERGFERAEAIGESLARHVLDNVMHVDLEDRVAIASVGVPLELPSFQLRLHRSWRLSPHVFGILGIDSDGWLHCVRIGDTYLVGMPADFSGEISVRMREWAAVQGLDLWVLSFNGDYIGYISPDAYYETAQKQGTEGYEMYVMSWVGPDQEKFFVTLAEEAIESLRRNAGTGS